VNSNSNVRPDWSFDTAALVGSGGFGRVYEALSPSGDEVVAKLIPKAPGATRDLLSTDLPQSAHLVPILHQDETSSHWVIYMPRARYSLRDALDERGAFNSKAAIAVMTDIAEGLRVMDGRVIHRDLKPENILFFDDSWAICDFGIARYTEASTAADTHKYSMSAPYAAPEQWKSERASSATDVYAFGIIGYELVNGTRPFTGPDSSSYRNQHLHQEAPAAPTSRRLANLLAECMYKAPASRPSPENILARLARANTESMRPGASSLAEAQGAVVAAQQTAQRNEERARTENERREQLQSSARRLLESITQELVEAITDEAPATKIFASGYNTRLALGSAVMQISEMEPCSVQSVSLEIVAHASIELTQKSGRAVHRSHSLYYADFEREGAFSWYELAFSSTMTPNFSNEPRKLHPAEGLAALSPTFGVYQLDEFVDKWSHMFGLAAQENLHSPMQLPEGNPRIPHRQ
jgi:serine/threonine protein kinase